VEKAPPAPEVKEEEEEVAPLVEEGKPDTPVKHPRLPVKHLKKRK